MSSLPCCLLLPHQKPHSFCRKLLKILGSWGQGGGGFDNFFFVSGINKMSAFWRVWGRGWLGTGQGVQGLGRHACISVSSPCKK
jgi:hypothetical protein